MCGLEIAQASRRGLQSELRISFVLKKRPRLAAFTTADKPSSQLAMDNESPDRKGEQ
jgi:hypothetical protein